MKNIVVKKFIDNKLDRNIYKDSLYGDIIEQIDIVLNIADTNKNIKESTSEFMSAQCVKLKKDFITLYKSKKFNHLGSYSIYRLTKLKNKLDDVKVFEL